MSDIALTANGLGLDLTGRALNLVTGADAVAQQLLLRLNFFLGEHFLDERVGIPYLTEFYVKNPDLDLLRSIFRRTMLTTPGVVAVDTLTVSINKESRTLEVKFKAVTDGGEIIDTTREPFIIEI